MGAASTRLLDEQACGGLSAPEPLVTVQAACCRTASRGVAPTKGGPLDSRCSGPHAVDESTSLLTFLLSHSRAP